MHSLILDENTWSMDLVWKKYTRANAIKLKKY